MIHKFVPAVIAVLGLIAIGSASAQDYPSRVVRMVWSLRSGGVRDAWKPVGPPVPGA